MAAVILILFIVVLYKVARRPPPQPRVFKTCPACAERVQAAAVICRHCHTDLSKTPITAVTRADWGLFMRRYLSVRPRRSRVIRVG